MEKYRFWIIDAIIWIDLILVWAINVSIIKRIEIWFCSNLFHWISITFHWENQNLYKRGHQMFKSVIKSLNLRETYISISISNHFMFCYSKIIYDTAFTWVKSTKQLKTRVDTKSILDISRLYPVIFSVGNSENTKDIGTQETEQRSYVSFRWEISNFNILLSNWCTNGKHFDADFFGLWKFSCARSDRVDHFTKTIFYMVLPFA